MRLGPVSSPFHGEVARRACAVTDGFFTPSQPWDFKSPSTASRSPSPQVGRRRCGPYPAI